MPDILKRRLREAAVILGLAAAFTFFGVYGNNGALWARYLMWVVTIAVGSVSAQVAVPLVFERKVAGEMLPVQVAVAAALIAVPVLAALVGLMGLLGYWVPVADLPLQFVYVFAICLVMTIGGLLIDRAVTPARHSASPDAGAATRFLERLPVKYRGAELWAVSSEDHYLRVHTSRGEELILMRLSDALKELAGVEGAQVHRSWWVARSGVGDAVRENGKPVLKLKSGKEAPVSRTHQSAAKDAGLV